MKVLICIGGNKQVSAQRLGVSLAARLQAGGKEAVLFAPKGLVKFTGGIPLKEYASAPSAKTLAGAFTKAQAQAVISLMDLRACEAAGLAGVPFIYAEYEGFKEARPARNKKSVLKKAQQVLVLGNVQKPLPKTYHGLPARRVVAPAVATEHNSRHKPACFKKENNIVAVGKLAKESGFERLLGAWAKLAPLHPSWHLTLVGDGSLKMILNRLIAKHHLQESTALVSAAQGTQPLLAGADIFVYPALNPARADELLDAMASKLPSVAFDSPAVQALVQDGVNGVIVEDEPAFVHALDALMVDWGLRVGLATAAAQHKSTYCFDDFVRAMWEALA